MRSPHRNRARSGDLALQICGEAAVCRRCRLRSPHRNRARSGDLDLQVRDNCCRAGDRPPRYGILHLYRRARACPSPVLENAITPPETGPRYLYRRARACPSPVLENAITPPETGPRYLYRRARACPSPVLENAITPPETGPRATGPLHGPFYRRVRKRSFFMREWTTKCS